MHRVTLCESTVHADHMLTWHRFTAAADTKSGMVVSRVQMKSTKPHRAE
jgi:hypothetical protein